MDNLNEMKRSASNEALAVVAKKVKTGDGGEGGSTTSTGSTNNEKANGNMVWV